MRLIYVQHNIMQQANTNYLAKSQQKTKQKMNKKTLKTHKIPNYKPANLKWTFCRPIITSHSYFYQYEITDAKTAVWHFECELVT